MIISITNKIDEQYHVTISAENVQNETKIDVSGASIYLTKNQLHDFIGGLLHLQSKLKGGKK